MEQAQPHDDKRPQGIPSIDLRYVYQKRRYEAGDGFPPGQFLPAHKQGVDEIIHAKRILDDGEFFQHVTWGNDEAEYRLSLFNGDTVYVNIYQRTREYGGPEEGGWWYDAEYPIQTHHSTPTECFRLKGMLEGEWGPGDESLVPLDSKQYVVRIEPHKGYGTPRPRYE